MCIGNAFNFRFSFFSALYMVSKYLYFPSSFPTLTFLLFNSSFALTRSCFKFGTLPLLVSLNLGVVSLKLFTSSPNLAYNLCCGFSFSHIFFTKLKLTGKKAFALSLPLKIHRMDLFSSFFRIT